jgi:hypothetical protein
VLLSFSLRVLGIDRSLHASQHRIRQDRPSRLTRTWTSRSGDTPG